MGKGLVLEGLRGEDSIAELCRREGINTHVSRARWSKEFLEAGKKRLSGDTVREATSDEVKTLSAETASLKESLAEVVMENRHHESLDNNTCPGIVAHIAQLATSRLFYRRLQDIFDKGLKFRIVELHGEKPVVAVYLALLLRFIQRPSVKSEVDI